MSSTVNPTGPALSAPLETPQHAFSAAVLALREVGRVLGTAVAIRYEAPPGFRPAPNRDGILDPTLDLVTDPRRVQLGEAIDRTRGVLAAHSVALRAAFVELSTALERWEGSAP